MCEVCGFDFKRVYDDYGYGFIECHHTKPLSEVEVGEKAKMTDLLLVCSNYHQMIHKRQPWLSVEDLRRLVRIYPT